MNVKANFVLLTLKKYIFQNNNINRYSFRNSDFAIPRVNTVTYGKHSLRYLGPFLWSKLDKKVRNSEFLNTFKANIRILKFKELANTANFNAYYKKLVFLIRLIYFLLTFNLLVVRCPQLVYVYVS